MEEDVLPICPALWPRWAPLEVQAASYFAASVRMVNFSRTSTGSGPLSVQNIRSDNNIEQTLWIVKGNLWKFFLTGRTIVSIIKSY